jgi:hypothetical protein
MTLSDKGNIVLLGGNVLNSGIADYCRQRGYKVIVVDWSPGASLKGDLFLCMDVKDTESIIRALRENHVSSILGAFTSIDLAVPSMNAINRCYGLASMDYEAIGNALPKSEMTRIWNDAGILNRYSRVFESFSDDIVGMVIKMKIIVKPNISSSSRGITILEKGSDRDTVKNAFEKAAKESFDRKVIVEEFVTGREFTCDMLGDSYGNVSVYGISVKYHTRNTQNNRIAVKLHYNSDCYPDETYRRIARTGKLCYKALGFRSSFGHLEIIMKDDGTLSPVEIGARSSGFIANPLVSIASGQDYFGDYIRILHGSRLSGQDFINGKESSMYFFYDMPKGKSVHHPCSIMDFLPESISSDYSNRAKVMEYGRRFDDISNDNERIGYEILRGDRHELSIDTVENAEKDFIRHNTQE